MRRRSTRPHDAACIRRDGGTGPRATEALTKSDSDHRAEEEPVGGSSVHPPLPIITIVTIVTVAILRRRIRLVADDRTAKGPGRTADRRSRACVVMDLVADDRACPRTERAADERAFFTPAE